MKTITVKLTRCLLSFYVAICFIATSCSRNDDVDATPLYPPVETEPANTNYQPAFPGQTRIASVKTETNIKKRILTQALQAPWSVKCLPDGRLLVTEKAGNLRIVSITGELSDVITGLFEVNAAGQGGLLDVYIDPMFETNRMLYWTFSQSLPEGNLTAVAKGRLSEDETKVEEAEVIYQAMAAYNGNLHYGSRIVMDADRNLLVSTGERSDLVTRPQAQSRSSALGKIIRITTEGQPSQGNPFMGDAEAWPELYSIGHRNPQGLAFHPQTAELWSVEHGPRGGDELNLIKAGANYGWPAITYGLEYSGQPIEDAIQQQDGMEQPVYYWDPVVSPSGMSFYNSNRIAEWQNNLFIGALSGKHIVRLLLENNRVVGEERLLQSEGQRFRDVTVNADGLLYAITDEGRLYELDKE